VASIKLYFGDADAASVDFQEALLIQQCVFGDDHPIPLQTEESLLWIEGVRAPPSLHRSRRPAANDPAADALAGAHFGIFSRMFRRSGSGFGGGGGGGGSSSSSSSVAELGVDPADGETSSASSVPPGLLACAVRGDDAARDVLGTVEERLKRLGDQIELACGPPAGPSYPYEFEDDDEEEESDDESDDEDGSFGMDYGENFDSELSRVRRAVNV
jgi:hypothetical protein